MRIGIDARLYGVESGTGIGRYTQELLGQFLEIPNSKFQIPNDWTFTVFLQKQGYATFELPDPRWSKVLADFRPYTLGVQTRFPQLIREARVDLMHFTHFDHPIRCPVPFVTTIHDLILLHHPSIRASTLGPLRFWVKYRAYRTVLRHAARASQQVLTPSGTIRAQLHAELGVPLERITATPLGVDHQTKFQISNLKFQIPEEPFLLYIGNAYPHKQLNVLIASIGELRKRWTEDPLVSHCALVIIGREDDFSRRIRTETADCPWVIWYGPASEEERTQLVRNAVAYITMSADEGFDLPCVEALALGTPVIASDIPVHREILSDSAIILSERMHAELPETVRDLVVNRNPQILRATLARKGRARAQRYTWSTCAMQTLGAYREALAFVDGMRSET